MRSLIKRQLSGGDNGDIPVKHQNLCETPVGFRQVSEQALASKGVDAFNDSHASSVANREAAKQYRDQAESVSMHLADPRSAGNASGFA